MNSGIYKIENVLNGKLYIGSSVDLKNRKSKHLSGLRNNTHSNKHLQSAWNKYGENSFEFSIIEIIDDIKALIEREQYWLDIYKCYDKNIGYNISPTAGNTTGCYHTDESRKKISEAKKGFKHTEEFKKFIGECNSKRVIDSNTRKKLSKSKKKENLSKETIKKLQDANKGNNNPNAKLDEDMVREIKIMLKDGFTQKEIANKFGVSRATIGKIKNSLTWVHVEIGGDSFD